MSVDSADEMEKGRFQGKQATAFLRGHKLLIGPMDSAGILSFEAEPVSVLIKPSAEAIEAAILLALDASKRKVEMPKDLSSLTTRIETPFSKAAGVKNWAALSRAKCVSIHHDGTCFVFNPSHRKRGYFDNLPGDKDIRACAGELGEALMRAFDACL